MKEVAFKYGKKEINLKIPDSAIVYKVKYNKAKNSPSGMLEESLKLPIGCAPLSKLLQIRKAGRIVIVVSDITRPIPYYSFLPQLIEYLIKTGITRKEILILIATGIHRPSTKNERIEMFGQEVVDSIQIIDHEAENENELITLDGKSWSGSTVQLNKNYVNAGFRIVTGLVEPHFMAGFSGGRKAICPGLASLDTVQKFHGYGFLSHPNACNVILEDNPCHQENMSIAKMCPSEYAINIVLDQYKNLNAIFSGDLFFSHEKTIEYVKKACCPKVIEKAGMVVTSSGGYPLDTTFYQCVKAMVSCLPAVGNGGTIITFGSCSEGIGSPEYAGIMKKYSGKYKQFIEHIKDPSNFNKDQWQFQMQIKALDKTGQERLHFFTSGIPEQELKLLSVNPHYVNDKDFQNKIQLLVNQEASLNEKIAVVPDGPYCALTI